MKKLLDTPLEKQSVKLLYILSAIERFSRKKYRELALMRAENE